MTIYRRKGSEFHVSIEEILSSILQDKEENLREVFITLVTMLVEKNLINIEDINENYNTDYEEGY